MDLSFDASRSQGLRNAGCESQHYYSRPTICETGTSRSHVLLFKTAKRFYGHPLSTAFTLMAQGTRLSATAVNSTTISPVLAVQWTATVTLHPLQSFNIGLNKFLGPIVHNQDNDCANERISYEASGPLGIPFADLNLDSPYADESDCIAETQLLEKKLETATSFAQFKPIAKRLGQLDGFEKWTQDEHSESYDVECIKNRLSRLETASDNGDPLSMLRMVRADLTRHLADMDQPALFYSNRYGTKVLIERYTNAVCDILTKISRACEGDDGELNKTCVKDQLLNTRSSFGRTALLFSGGGTLGMTHIGVLKALFEAGNLPRVIAGSSAGAIVSAILCTKADHEIPKVLEDFCKGNLKVFIGDHEEQGFFARLKYFVNNGHIFDPKNLCDVMKHHLGNLTFQQAYNKTGRILNITVSSTSPFESIRLLNYATAGNILIWSAVAASCAIPFGFKPGCLHRKNHDGTIEEDNSAEHMDGSIDADLPFAEVSAIFNVNHFIVSQVNPHVRPFLRDQSKDKHQGNKRVGTFRDTLLGMCKDEIGHWLKPETTSSFHNWRKIGSSVIGQRYTGDITIFPKDSQRLFLRVLSNPTVKFMQDASNNGELATRADVSKVTNHLKIEVAIDAAVKKLGEHILFSKSASDLRRRGIKQHRNFSRSGRNAKRPNRSGSQQSANSAVLSRSVSARQVGHRATRSMFDAPLYLVNGPATKIAGEPHSPSSPSSTSHISFSPGTDEEDDDEEHVEDTEPELQPMDRDIDEVSLEIMSAPTSPRPRFKTLLMMTPASPNINSIRSKDQQRRSGPASRSTEPSPATPHSSHRGRSTQQSRGKSFVRHVSIERISKKLLRKRSFSADSVLRRKS